MEATEMRIDAYAGSSGLHPVKVSLSAVGPNEVLLRQTAVGVNFHDIYQTKGIFPLPQLPGPVGIEGVGVVEAVGSEVRSLRMGDRVGYAGPPFGSYASARVLSAEKLVRLPAHVSDEEAAVLMLKGMTAHMIFSRVRRLGPGDSLLLHSAAGGLGVLMAGWAKALGARVIGTVGGRHKVDIAREAGCDEVILYKEQDFVAETLRLTGGAGVDMVCEGIGGDILTRSLECMRPFGVAVNLGQTGAPLGKVDLADLGPRRSLSVAVPGVFAHMRTVPDLQAAADEMFAMAASGAVKPRIGLRLPLTEAAEAHRRLASGETVGAIVLLP